MMKPIKQTTLLILTAAALLCGGCTGEGLVSSTPGERGSAARAHGYADGTVTIPFKAAFHTDLAGLMPDASCGDPAEGWFMNIQEGSGQATHLGRIAARITFCVNAADLLDDGQLTADESLPYHNGTGAFTAANGDELWIAISGAVLPSDHPDYDFEFADPFEFTGGTGRFEGAGGAGVTDSFVNNQTSRTDHGWTGLLTLPSGK